LADAVATLLGQYELCCKMGEAGRERVLSLFSQDAHIEQVLNLYKTLLKCNSK